MLESSQFHDYVKEALSHLNDRPYLETHPLADLLVTSRLGQPRSRILQQLLLSAIQALDSRPDLHAESLVRRKYRFLQLRYIHDLPVPDVARGLGISARQCRRYSIEALEAVTHILWDQYLQAGHLTSLDSTFAQQDNLGSERTDTTVEPSLVEQEASRLGAAGRGATSLSEVLGGVVATIGPLAERRGVRLDVTLPTPSLTVAIERTVLRQALLSVLSSALDQAGAEIVLLTEVDGTGAEVCVVVHSEIGSGSARAADRLTADERWLIASSLLQAKWAHLEVQSAVDRVLTVRVRLRSAREVKVLVVEDNPDAVELYRRYLTGSAYDVLIATNGAAALEQARRLSPTVIVLDVMMPEQDGWEVLQLLKSSPSTEHIPVIICTVLRERDLAIALGAAELLVKPVTRRDLLMTLDRLCRRRDAARPDPPASNPSILRP